MEGHESDTKGTRATYFEARFNTLGKALKFLAFETDNFSGTSLSESLGEFIASNPKRPTTRRSAQDDDYPKQQPSEHSIERWWRDSMPPSTQYFRLMKDYFRYKLGASTFNRIESDLHRLFLEAERERKPQPAGQAAPGDAAIHQAIAKIAAFERRLGNAPPSAWLADRQIVSDWVQTHTWLEQQIEQTKECEPFAGAAAALLALDHWNDGHAAHRKIAYLPLARLISYRLKDLRSFEGLHFHTMFAHLADITGHALEADESFTLLPSYLNELPDRAVSTLIVERTDTMLTALGPVSKTLCERLANEGGRKTALGQAGIWRCAACRALRTKDLSAVRDAVDASRSHLGRAPPGRERQTIENYLAMIETMADWHERGTPSRALDQRLDQAITAIQALDPRDRPMLAGLWSIRLDAALEPRQRAGEEEARLQRLRDAALTIQTLNYGSVQSFCAFDPADIHNRATRNLQPAR
jgi:hypothetical protein